MDKIILDDEFLSGYGDAPDHMTEVGKFVYYRTYSRWLESEKRRETWKETCKRSVEYNINLEVDYWHKTNRSHIVKNKFYELKHEAELLFHNMFNLKQFLSGRTLWVGGTEASKKYPLSNFNCAFIDVKSWEDLGDLFYLLLLGTGVGFKCSQENAKKLKKIKLPKVITHKEYKFTGTNGSDGNIYIEKNIAKITIGDSKEGWVKSFIDFMYVLTSEENIERLEIIYDNVRPKGTRLKTFGGTASGHEPLFDMFSGIERLVRGELDTTTVAPIDGQVRPIHILDIGNLIGNNVVAGGVRRTAEIFLCDEDDWESIFSKFGINGIWGEDGAGTLMLEKIKEKIEHINKNKLTDKKIDTKTIDMLIKDPMCKTSLHHRRMSNNSVAFNNEPHEDILELLFLIMRLEGEPGFVNMKTASQRRVNFNGLNPCAEILLDSYGVCNLTTLNLSASWSSDDLHRAQALSARCGLRMTLPHLELDHWDKIQQRDRLLGCSLTGVQDACIDDIKNTLIKLREIANETAKSYADELGINAPLLVTTVKPEGTLSIVAGGVSSGVHFSHSEYFIRRIRVNAHDPLAMMARDLGWRIHPEVGQTKENATTLVIDFPIYSPSKKHKKDVDFDDQIKIYEMFQTFYTDHNTSNTIHIKPSEWKNAHKKIKNIWDKYIGISFLADDGGTYPLAPYEECTQEEYCALKNSMKKFDHEILRLYDNGGTMDVGDESCETGVCPVR